MTNIREAKKSEANSLTNLALNSKAYWGYSKEFMEACSNELLVTDEMIDNKTSYYAVIEDNENLMGFYSLNDVSTVNIELGLLFVAPQYIGSGVGRKLIEHAKNYAKNLGGAMLYFQGDPNAEGFYKAIGAKLTGKQESLIISGRFIPTFSISLLDADVVLQNV